MRFFTAIFSIYILFLAVEPGIKSIGVGNTKTECCGGSCTPVSDEKSPSEKKSDSKDEKGNAACNPFANCQACIGYTVTLAFITETPVPTFTELQTPRTEKIPAEVALDFWQPPKLS